jgi:ribose transport system substrate-binding protein
MAGSSTARHAQRGNEVKKLKKLLWIVILPAALGVVGCKHGNEVKVALIAPSASDFWAIVAAGAKKGGEDFKVDTETITPSQASAVEQRSHLEDLLSKGVKYIAIAPYDAKHEVDMINDACDKATVITTDSDAPDSKRLCYVGTNNLEAGKRAGELLKKALPNGGKVWIFVATQDMQNAKDRIDGLEETVKGTKIQILGVKTDEADRNKAKSNVENAMVVTPDVAALVGIFSYNGPAIADAVTAAHKEHRIKIVCFDEDGATLKGVKDGVIEGTVVQDPFKFGYECVHVLAAIAHNEDPKIPASKVIDTGVQIVDKSNVDAFQADFKKKLGK